MAAARRKWSREEKLAILAEIENGRGVSEISRAYDVSPNQIYNWRTLHQKYGDEAFQGNGRTYTHEARIAELERKVGQLTMENDLLKKRHRRLINGESGPSPKGGKS